jgi:hypothetical protein
MAKGQNTHHKKENNKPRGKTSQGTPNTLIIIEGRVIPVIMG